MLIMRWTEEENEIIVNNKLNGVSYVEIAKLLPNRSYSSVRVQGFKLLGSTSKKTPWSDKEENLLLVLRELEYPYREIAEILGRTKDSVSIKVQNLIKEGRTKPKLPNSYTREQLLEIVKTYKKRTLCPYDKLYHIKKEFGSWSEAAIAAGIPVGGLDPSINTTIYLLDFGDYYKVGITQQTIKQRFYGVHKDYTVVDYIDTNLKEARGMEKLILAKVKDFLYRPNELEGNGSTECFKLEKRITSLNELLKA